MRLGLRAAAAAGVAGVLAGAAAAPRPAPLGRVVSWDSHADPQGARWRIGPYDLTLGSASTTQDGSAALSPWLKIDAPAQADGRTPEVTLAGAPAFPDRARAAFAVARLDPSAPAPDVILSSYTGGAHCCEDLQVAVPAGRGWTVLHVGQFDNTPIDPQERGLFRRQLTDLDGDGAAELLIQDDRFAYQFASFAGSAQPLRVFKLQGTTLEDRTDDPAFRELVAADMAPYAAACRAGEGETGGVCAAYVADASRLGRFAQAWAVMLARRRPQWDHPPRRCGATVTYARRCPGGAAPRSVPDYPTALRLFLRGAGYPVPPG